jgi:hypothetical protein
LLGSHPKRPRDDRAAEQRDEFTTLWSIEVHLQRRQNRPLPDSEYFQIQSF